MSAGVSKADIDCTGSFNWIYWLDVMFRIEFRLNAYSNCSMVKWINSLGIAQQSEFPRERN